jgi:hypothetical protein
MVSQHTQNPADKVFFAGWGADFAPILRRRSINLSHVDENEGADAVDRPRARGPAS